MKKILLIMLLIAGFAIAQTEIKSSTVTVDSAGTTATVDITSVTDISSANDFRPVYFYTPAALTSTTATIKIYDRESGTYKTLRNEFGNVSYTVAASGCYILRPSYFLGTDKFQIVFGSAEAAERTITIVVRRY